MSRLGHIYFIIVSTVGISLLLLALPNVLTLSDWSIVWLLFPILLLATQAVVARGILTVDLYSALNLVVVAVWGVDVAVVMAVIGALTLSFLLAYRQKSFGLREIRRTFFNPGVAAVTTLISGLLLTAGLNSPLGTTLWGSLLVWFLASLIYDQINLWLVALIVAATTNHRPQQVWWNQRWAIPINICVTAVGGIMTAYATQQAGIVGLLVFFMPVLFSTYSFRLYLRETDHKMAELEGIVADRTEHLTNLLREKDAFLTLLNHDMHTILANIRLYTTLLRDKPNASEAQRQRYVSVILRNERDLLDIANNILEIEQLSLQTRSSEDRELFALDPLVPQIVASLSQQSESKQITVTVDIKPQLIMVQANKSKIERIFHNLLSNAIKYTPSNGRVTIHIRTEKSELIFRIQDTGHGIPAADLEHIFEKYYRAEPHKLKAHGTGLGLALVHHFVEAHHGRITVESVEDEGSTFTVRLPIVISDRDITPRSFKAPRLGA